MLQNLVFVGPIQHPRPAPYVEFLAYIDVKSCSSISPRRQRAALCIGTGCKESVKASLSDELRALDICMSIRSVCNVQLVLVSFATGNDCSEPSKSAISKKENRTHHE